MHRVEGDGQEGLRVTGKRCGISFCRDDSVLQLIVTTALHNALNTLEVTELHTING